MKKIFVFMIIMIIAIAITAGCIDNAGDSKNVNPSMTTTIINYGNGTYYFYGTGSYYANSLSAFIGSHPELRLVSQASDNRGDAGIYDHSQTLGYIVVFETRPTEAAQN